MGRRASDAVPIVEMDADHVTLKPELEGQLLAQEILVQTRDGLHNGAFLRLR